MTETATITAREISAANCRERLLALGEALDLHRAEVGALLLVGTPEARGLAQAVKAATADCRMGTRDGARAALSQLQGMHGALETFRQEAGVAGRLATAAASAVPTLQELSGGWVEGPAPTGREALP